jgi:hypothetical protein
MTIGAWLSIQVKDIARMPPNPGCHHSVNLKNGGVYVCKCVYDASY